MKKLAWFKDEEKVEAYKMSEEQQCYVEPFMTEELYNRHPRDYKGNKNGVPYIMYRDNIGLTYGPVYLIKRGMDENAFIR